jgi:hypothetical protein
MQRGSAVPTLNFLILARFQTALLTLGLNGTQKIADARAFWLQINPLHHCGDERLNLRIK